MISAILSLSLFLLFSPDGASGQNILCMMMHCAEESKNCMLDSDCRSALACITGCGTQNETCMFDCLYSYEDDVFDTFMKCAFTEHKCITMVSPDPNFRCKPPHPPLQTLSAQQLKGAWYIVLGLNPNFDCFDCQITTFQPSNTSNTLFVNELFEVHTVDGKLKHRLVNETAVQNTSVQGLLEYKSMQMGHETTTEWRILYQDPKLSYMIGYYCGHVASDWYYEGSVVFSRMPALSSEVLTEVKGHMTSLGLPVNQFCAPKTSNCF
ncbi:uncharacterized protein LOC132561125 [Ylistrum balloti]|uniref:uncharacterized protein LOC132561125 n=1 Tax=Ylistrum balloti TaxID=509963 RepID=UPI002905AD71|nr:uncharacterized protein LOC132561125 [Ylistrum balloti]